MEQYFPKFPLKRSTSRGTRKFSKNFFPEVFFPFHFVPGISRIFGWRVRFSEIQQWNSGIFRYHLPLFPILRKFWLSGKRPFSFWEYPLFLFAVVARSLSAFSAYSSRPSSGPALPPLINSSLQKSHHRHTFSSFGQQSTARTMFYRTLSQVCVWSMVLICLSYLYRKELFQECNVELNLCDANWSQ